MNSPIEPNKTLKNNPGKGDQRIPELSYQSVAESAYYKAQQRNFAPGHEMEDWLAAERECILAETLGIKH